MDFAINYLAVIIAAIASMIIGALWYSPILFGKQWMVIMGFSEEHLEEMKREGMGKSYAISFVASLIMSFVIAQIVETWNAIDIGDAFEITILVWLGFIVTILLNSVLWERRPVRLYLINISHYFVAILVMAIIITYWI